MIWEALRGRKQMLIQNFGKGLNTDEDITKIDADELTDCLNVSCDDYPIVRTRNDRVLEDCDAIAVPKGIGQRGTSQMHVLDDAVWKYRTLASTAWTDITTFASTAGSTQASFIEYNIQTASYSVIARANSSLVQNGYWTEGSTFEPFTTSYSDGGTTYTNYPPQSNLMVSHKYRLYGMSFDKRTLWYSELGNPLWYKAANYLDVTEVKGGVQAMAVYQDHVIMWGEHSMHELYGVSAFDHELINISKVIGCVGKYAYTECDGRLYWLDYGGVFMYTGGLPRPVGAKAAKYFKGINWNFRKLITMGNFESKLYISIPYKSTANNKLIVIDTEDIENGYERISIEDNADVQSFVNISDKIYGLHNDGRIWDMHSTQITGKDNSTAISWNIESKPLTDSGLNVNSAIREVWTEHQGTTDATMALKYSTNSHSTTYSTFMASTDFVHSATIVRTQKLCRAGQLQGMNYVKWQFSGTGYKKIYGIQSELITYGNLD